MSATAMQIWHRKDARLAVGFFVLLAAFWLFLNASSRAGDALMYSFSSTYPLLALAGGVVGLLAARRWGSLGSALSRTLLFFSVGLLLQFFGQVAYTVSILVLHTAIPYPSLGDIGYFGSAVVYLIACFQLLRAVGFRTTNMKLGLWACALIVPCTILLFTYFFFLRNYFVDWSTPIKTLLDFGYPIVQAGYVAIALVGLAVSQRIRGGALRGALLFLLAALVFQYICDVMFLVQATQGTWQAGNLNDFMYFVSYLLMTLALISLDTSLLRIRQRNEA